MLGVVVVLGLPSPNVESPPINPALPVLEPLPQTQNPQTSPVAAVDAAGIADRLALVSNAPRPADAPAPPDTATPPPQEQDFAYLGPIRMGRVLWAFVRDSGAQRPVKVGDAVWPGRVVAITSDKLTVERDGVRTDYDLLPRGGAVVSRASSGAAPAPPARGRGRPQPLAGAAPINPNTGFPDPQGSPVGMGMSHMDMIRKQPGFQEHLERLRASGKYPNEEDLQNAAVKTFEEELRQQEEKRRAEEGGG
jgi:hypothetical protein